MVTRPWGIQEDDPGQRVALARSRVAALENELLVARAELAELEGLATDVACTADSQPASTPSAPPEGAVWASSSPEDKLAEFARRFVGRKDAYATRWVSRKTGRAGWSPAVKGGFYTDSKTNADLLPLTSDVLERHLRGSGEDQHEFHVGLYPMTVDDQCALLACDFDGSSWRDDAAAYAQACTDAGIDCLAEISPSGDGAHVWIFFEVSLSAAVARRAGMVLLLSLIHI